MATAPAALHAIPFAMAIAGSATAQPNAAGHANQVQCPMASVVRSTVVRQSGRCARNEPGSCEH
jgi:hypothetical protein